VDDQRILNRLEIWRSLRTDSIAVAARRLPSVVARIEMEIEQAHAMAGMPIDPALILPLNDDSDVRPSASPPAPSRVQADTALTLGEAYRSYIDDPTRAWTANTREAYETSRKLAIAVIGEALPIASVSRTHCRDFLDVLRFLPANAGKLFPKLSPREAADRARLRGDIKIISAANANSLMSNTNSFLNWAVNEELLARNPERDQLARLALLWQNWFVGGRQPLMTVRALRGWRSCQPINDCLSDSRQGRLRGGPPALFFPPRCFEAARLQESVGEHRHQGMPV
jgi:hypothetical protein